MTDAPKLPHTADGRPVTRREATLLPRKGSNSARASSGFPLLDDKVWFQRTTGQDFETGFVKARIFGTCEIEIEDMQGKRLRLAADQYQDFNQMTGFNAKSPPQGDEHLHAT
jgi:hypothetical protein